MCGLLFLCLHLCFSDQINFGSIKRSWIRSSLLFVKDRNQGFWPISARGPWPETFKASFSRTNQTANKGRRQKKGMKIFKIFSSFIKRNQDKKLLEISQNFLKTSTHQITGLGNFLYQTAFLPSQNKFLWCAIS